MTGTYISSTGEATLSIGNKDDGFYNIYLPYNFGMTWGGISFINVYISTNSYVFFNTYMSPQFESAGPFSAASWSYPGNSKLFISAADNCCQRVFTKQYTEDGFDKFTIRYEGCSWNGTTTPAGQSNIIWELTFIKDYAYANKAILEVILNGRITNQEVSYSALCGGSTQLQTFTPLTGTAWLIELGPNQSTWSIASLPFKRKKKLVVSGQMGVMVIGDEELPTGTTNAKIDQAIADPETYRTQIYFHSNLPYISISNFVSIPLIAFPELAPDLRTWADPGSDGHDGALGLGIC